jgi:hypothetical protein
LKEEHELHQIEEDNGFRVEVTCPWCRCIMLSVPFSEIGSFRCKECDHPVNEEDLGL